MAAAFTAKQALSGGTDITFQANTNPSFQNYFMSASGLGVYATTYNPTFFGNQPQNSSSQPQYVWLKDDGNAPMHVSGVSLIGADASQFAVTSDACSGATLNPGNLCLVYISFRPSAVGTFAPMVSFTDDAPDSPQLSTIRGTGIAPGAIVSPAAIDFGVVSDAGSASQAVQLSNPTGQPLHVTSASITSGGAVFSTSADTCTGATVPAGSTCSLAVRFAPVFAFAGFTGTLTLSDDAGQQAVSLAGHGVDPQVSYAPDQINFGNQRVTTRSAPITLTITNSSSASWTPQHVQLEANNFRVFAIDASGCTQALAPGASCQALLNFTPSGTNSFSALVDVYNPVTGSINKVPVSGAGVAPVIPATAGIFFPDTRVGTTFSGYGLGLTNAGTDTLHVSSFSITGPNASAFAAAASNCLGVAIAPNSTCAIPLTFTPSVTGPFAATLNVVDDAWNGPSQFALSGTGVQSHATFTPSSVSFPNTVTGQSASQTITVSSDGTASLNLSSITLSGSGAAAYSISADTCSGQQWPATIACSFKVTFAPQANGLYPASVLIADDAAGSPQSISLTGTDFGSDATASPSSLSFGALRPGTTASPQTVTLTNDGSTTVHVTSAALTGDPSFSLSADACTGATLNAGAACTIQVGFSPATLGSLSATLSFGDDAANSPQPVAVSGSGIQPAVSLSTTSLAFGNLVVGTTSANQPVVVTNSGTDTLTIGAVTLAAPFGITSDGCSSKALAAGASCTIQVDFAPTATGPASAALSLPDDAPGSPQTVAVSGTGTNPHATASPASIAFGSVTVGKTATPQTITFTNDGSTTVHVSPVTLTGESVFSLSADTCSGASLASGTTCTVHVGFAPASVGSQLATVAFSDDAANSPQTVALSGRGIQPAVSLSPSSLSFGNQLVGTTSTAQSVVVTNSGSDTLNIATATTAAPFAIVSDGCSSSAVPAGSSCTIQVDFAPTAMGPVGGKMQIPDDAPGSPQTVALSGTGLQQHATASPTTVAFGAVRLGKSASPQTVTLTNDGNTTIHVTSAALTGSSAFSLAADTCSGATLSLGTACTVQVGFAPAALGALSGTLTFTDDASSPTQTATLSGSGVQPAVSLSPSSLAFGNQLVGTRSASRPVVVTNSGTDTLNVGAASAGAPFVIVADGCSNTAVAARASCTIQVAFAPTATGAAGGTLSIPDDAPGSPHALALSGTGVQPQATVTPTSLSFGSVRVGPGSSAAQQYVTISNSGTADLHLASVTLAGDSAFTIGTPCPNATLAPGASCRVGIYASPDTIGPRSATLQVANDAPGSPQTVALSVTGLDGRLAATPASINFGSVKVNHNSSKVTIKVQNNGNAVLSISNVAMSGANPGSFVIASSSCTGVKLAPGASCSVTIYFRPQALGALSASLTFVNDGLRGTQSVPLSGTGIR
jgi:hypothetical protein